jgi:hypothetical protein
MPICDHMIRCREPRNRRQLSMVRVERKPEQMISFVRMSLPSAESTSSLSSSRGRFSCSETGFGTAPCMASCLRSPQSRPDFVRRRAMSISRLLKCAQRACGKDSQCPPRSKPNNSEEVGPSYHHGQHSTTSGRRRT